jgi:hypothetical protein
LGAVIALVRSRQVSALDAVCFAVATMDRAMELFRRRGNERDWSTDNTNRRISTP